ncbi:MAG: MBL fold metallo-hydrolase [Clostridia bacterium]|nr:MBL fold metallo-hydrolase [Clostridia bacterium]
MQIITVVCGALATNTYIVYEDGSQDCVIIDPADGAAALNALKECGKTCTHILLTHGHFDHIYGVAEVKRATNAEICIHEEDAAALHSGRANLALLIRERIEPTHADRLLKEGDVIEAAGLKFRVIHTPGHTAGGVLYAVDEHRAAFCGDTVFYESVGRTDLPGSSTRDLIDSFFNKVLPLTGYRLYPGHEEETTVAHEAQHNPLIAYYRR